MYQLNIGMGWTMLRLRFESPYNEPPIWSRLKQHRMIINKTIYSYYIDKAASEGLTDIFQNYFTSIANVDSATKEIDNNIGNSIGEVFKNYYCKKKNFEQVIAFEGDEIRCPKKACQHQYNSENFDNDTCSPLSLYSFDGTHNPKGGEHGKKYVTWLSNLLAEDEDITIIDPYIFGSLSPVESFCQIYLPLLKNRRLHIFCDEDKTKNEYLDYARETAKKYGISCFEVYFCSKMHPRYIVSSEVEIFLDYGLDFLKCENEDIIVKQGCKISWSKKRLIKKNKQHYLPMERETELMAGTVNKKCC